MIFRSFRRIACAAAFIACLAGAGAAQGQFGPISDPPTKPTNLAPATGIYSGMNAPTTPIVMSWGQYFPTGTGPFLRPPATHFVVCLDLATDPACSWTNGDYHETIASMSAALTRSGNIFTLRPSPQRIIAPAELNQDLRLTVGACSSPVNRSCAYTSAVINYSTANLRAAGTGVDNATSTVTTWVLDVRAVNEGTIATAAVDSTVEYWEVLRTATAGTDCLRAVDDPVIRNDMSLVAFDVNGTQTLVPSLPRVNGAYSGPSIQGIYRFGSPYDMANTTMNQGTSVGTNTRAIGKASFPVADSGGTRAYVVMSRIDSNGALGEFNESDNLRAQCKIR
jgi:hypothetical protein